MANGGEGGFTVGVLGDGDVGGLKSSYLKTLKREEENNEYDHAEPKSSMTITRKISCSSEIMKTSGRLTRGMVNDMELKSGEDHF